MASTHGAEHGLKRFAGFTDAVFAIALTLLFVEIVPPGSPDGPPAAADVARAVAEQWRDHLALIVSFLGIGIYWLQHYYSGSLYAKSDHVFSLINLGFLFGIMALPYPSRLWAFHLGSVGEAEASAILAAVLLLPSLFWLMKWFYPRLKNDLRRPTMEEVGDRTTLFEFGGLRDRQRDFIDWVLRASLEEGVEPEEVITDEAATLLAARLKTPLQLSRYLVRAFEAGFGIGAKPIDGTIVDGVLSRRLDDIEPELNRHGYDVKALCDQFDAKPAEIRKLMRGELEGARATELTDEMRVAGLPI